MANEAGSGKSWGSLRLSIALLKVQVNIAYTLLAKCSWWNCCEFTLRTVVQLQIFYIPALLLKLCETDWCWSLLGSRGCAWTKSGCSMLCSLGGYYHFLPTTDKDMAPSCMEEAVSFFWPTPVQGIRSGNCRALCTHGNDKEAQPWARECHSKFTLCKEESLSLSNGSPLCTGVFSRYDFFYKEMVKYAPWCIRICPIDNFTFPNLQLSKYTKILFYYKRLCFRFTWDFQIQWPLKIRNKYCMPQIKSF